MKKTNLLYAIVIIFIVFIASQYINFGLLSVSSTYVTSLSSCNSRRDDNSHLYKTYCREITSYANLCAYNKLNNYIGSQGMFTYSSSNENFNNWDTSEKIKQSCLGNADFFPNFDVNRCYLNTCSVDSDCSGCGSDIWRCQSGQCTSVSSVNVCVDTDNGNEIYDAGSTYLTQSGVTYGDVFKDTCVGSSNLKEYYCDSSGTIKMDEIYCPYGCSSGMCMLNSKPSFNVKDIQVTKDGDSVGSDHIIVTMTITSDQSVRAVVESSILKSSMLQAVTYISQNQCDLLAGKTQDPNYKNQYIDFTANTPKYITFEFTPTSAASYSVYFNIGSQCCTSSPCSTGDDWYSKAVLGNVNFGSATSCTDSDGLDYYTWGKVTKGSSSYADECVSGSNVALVEYICSNNNIQPVQYDCSTENKICSSGKCVISQASCTDSDGGKAYNVKGTVTVGSSSYTDECIQGFLIEYFCNGNINNYEGYQCPSGQTCSNGACVGGSTTCTPGNKRCSGDKLEVCNTAGTGWTGTGSMTCTYGCETLSSTNAQCKSQTTTCGSADNDGTYGISFNELVTYAGKWKNKQGVSFNQLIIVGGNWKSKTCQGY